MSDYISRQAAIDKFEPWLKVEGYSEGERNMLKAILYELRLMPTADVAPVVHGRWKRVGDTAWECSACGCISCCKGAYCPDCGASMMEGAEDGQTG